MEREITIGDPGRSYNVAVNVSPILAAFRPRYRRGPKGAKGGHGGPHLRLRGTILLILTLGSPLLAADPSRLTAPQRARLAHGEVLVEMVEVAGSPVREGVVRRVLTAPPERVYRAITDYAHYAEFMPFVTSSRPVAPTEVELALDLPWPSPDVRFRIRTESSAAEDRWASSWRLVPGSRDMVENRGDWSLERFGRSGTLVTLRLRSRTASAVPLRLQERGTHESLPWVLDGLRQHVGRCRYDQPRAVSCGE